MMATGPQQDFDGMVSNYFTYLLNFRPRILDIPDFSNDKPAINQEGNHRGTGGHT